MYRKLYLEASQLSPVHLFVILFTYHYPNHTIAMTQHRVRALVIGTGGVGTMAAYALEQGGKAEVTAVMRSNYDTVKRDGISINSIQYGNNIKGWRPTNSESN